MNSYELSRQWFNWAYDNTSKIKPIHSALYFFIIEHHNRLGKPKEFGLPRDMAMDALGVKNTKTYSKAFDQLEEWEFIEVKERSKNQWTANIIALLKNTKATTKALTNASLMQLPKHYPKQLPEHIPKQVQGTYTSIAPIIKPNNLRTKEPKREGNSLAFDFMINENQIDMDSFQMQNKPQVQEWENLIESFNDTIDLELAKGKIDFQYDQLLPRLRKFTRSWISNQKNKSQSNANLDEGSIATNR